MSFPIMHELIWTLDVLERKALDTSDALVASGPNLGAEGELQSPTRAFFWAVLVIFADIFLI